MRRQDRPLVAVLGLVSICSTAAPSTRTLPATGGTAPLALAVAAALSGLAALWLGVRSRRPGS